MYITSWDFENIAMLLRSGEPPHWPAGNAVAIQPQYELAFGEDLKAGAEASDKKVDSLPSFPDIGKALNSQFGQTDPKEVGKAIDKNTPGDFKLLSRCQADKLLLPDERRWHS